MNSGLIIDLQEIGFLLPKVAEIVIQQRGIDINTIHNLEKNDFDFVQILKRNFYLKNSDSIIDIEGNICSPWREHLMQRFSQGFIRIGLDGATDSDFKEITNRILD